MSRIGIIAALPGELKPLVRGWQALHLPTHAEASGRRPIVAWQARVAGAECVAVCAGMGAEGARQACGIAAGSGELDALISLGWAGALSCGVSPGKAYAVAEVIDAISGERFKTSFSLGGRILCKLVTLDHVAGPAEKRKLAETHRAVLVDMEAAAVGRFALDMGSAFYCFKAVSDAPQEILPDFTRYTDAAGQLETAALAAHVALRPRYWPAMARMGNNTRTGAAAMAAALTKFLTDGQNAANS